MTVFVNNQSTELLAPVPLQNLLVQLALSEKKGIAVAVNNAIIPRSEWTRFVLAENQRITILQATQGG